MLRKTFIRVAALLVAASFLTVAHGAEDDDVVVCELAYYTGEFGSYGPYLTASVSFPIDNIINADPPLGRSWDLISAVSYTHLTLPTKA